MTSVDLLMRLTFRNVVLIFLLDGTVCICDRRRTENTEAYRTARRGCVLVSGRSCGAAAYRGGLS